MARMSKCLRNVLVFSSFVMSEDLGYELETG